MKTIAIASGKGGVGKSTVTTQLASMLAHNGYKVGVIDADLYGPCQYDLLSASETEIEATPDNKIIPGFSKTHNIYYVSVNNLLPNEGNNAILWRAPIATKLIKEFVQKVAWPQLDFLFIDLPPGTGDIQITISQLAKLDGAIIVTTPQKVAYNIAAKAIQMFKKVNIKILGIIENMSGYVCSNCKHENKIFNPHDNEQAAGGIILSRKYNTELLGTVPLDSSLVTLSDNGQSVKDLADAHPVKQSYSKILQNVLIKLSSVSTLENSIHYRLENNTNLEIKNLSNNSTRLLSAYDLRVSCQCALCKDEATGRVWINKNIISKDITITNIHEVGNYGLRITFSDGHGSGIYEFNKLIA